MQSLSQSLTLPLGSRGYAGSSFAIAGGASPSSSIASSMQHSPVGLAATPTVSCGGSPASPLGLCRSLPSGFLSGDPGGSPVRQPGWPASVVVIAPGGGTSVNKAVYQQLGQDQRFRVEIVGRSRAEYDRYPESWAVGRPAPNLVSFSKMVLQQGQVDHCDCMVVGSRGGQIVLPTIWQHRGDRAPPVVIINGGCAMKLPTPVIWPRAAVTFLLIGGRDYFRGETTVDEYFADTLSWVPPENSTTAVLYVEEMTHMPQAELLKAVLPIMLTAVMSWKATLRPPMPELRDLVAALRTGGWSGRLCWTARPCEWSPVVSFSGTMVERLQSCRALASVEALHNKRYAINFTREKELQAIWRAAMERVTPHQQASTPADRFLMATKAMQANSQCSQGPGSQSPSMLGSLSPRSSGMCSLKEMMTASLSAPARHSGSTVPNEQARRLHEQNFTGSSPSHASQVGASPLSFPSSRRDTGSQMCSPTCSGHRMSPASNLLRFDSRQVVWAPA